MYNNLRAGLIILLVAASDLVSKFYMQSLFQQHEVNYIYINEFLNWTLIYNTGITFGFLNQLPYSNIIFSTIAIIIATVLLIWIRKSENNWQHTALSLITGGAIGNAIDRLINGAVTDFIDFHWQHHHWHNFNIADAAICVGVTIIIIESFFQPKQKGRYK